MSYRFSPLHQLQRCIAALWIVLDEKSLLLQDKWTSPHRHLPNPTLLCCTSMSYPNTCDALQWPSLMHMLHYNELPQHIYCAKMGYLNACAALLWAMLTYVLQYIGLLQRIISYEFQFGHQMAVRVLGNSKLATRLRYYYRIFWFIFQWIPVDRSLLRWPQFDLLGHPAGNCS